MAQLSDFISRIFSSDKTQGLSGGAEVVIDQDPASAFYASRLRKHRTDDDFIEGPAHLWSTLSFHGRRGGLRAHVQAERGDGVASFTDVLVVLNQADSRRANMVNDWSKQAGDAITEKFRLYCEKERFELLYGTRPLRFGFVEDGGKEMLGQSFNLQPGEFITGLLPNLYTGPAGRSKPVLAVHLNLPGVWEGYREVGRLYTDQILFTLGRHWADNFHHPALREPGLYRLQQYPDGSLVHVISPELQDRYLVRSDALDSGASVLTIAERNGTAVAYLVLAVMDLQLTMDGGQMAAELQKMVESKALSGATPTPASAAQAPSAGAAPSSAQAPVAQGGPGRADAAGRERRDMLQRTIIPDAVEARILTLQERGALLQRVHFSNFMEGYDVYIGSGGRVATQMGDPRATLQVRGARVSLLVQDPSVRIDGKSVPGGRAMALSGIVDIDVDGHVLQYVDLSGLDIDGWPYLAELRRPGGGSYLDFGGAFRIGRDRRCKVRLPDEPHNENIAWLPSVGGGTTIRSRTGDIPKSRFYTDSIMVASEHAEIDLSDEPVLRSLARHCFTYVRRGGEIFPLSPREGGNGRLDATLQSGDEVLVGNCLFHVSYPPAIVEEAASQPSIPPMSARDLAAPQAPAFEPPVMEPLPVFQAPVEPVAAPPAPTPTPTPTPVATPASPPVVEAPPPARSSSPPPGMRGHDTFPGEAPDAPAPSKRKAHAPSLTMDPAVAGGLGEKGPAPRPPRLSATSPWKPGGDDLDVPSPSLAAKPVPSPASFALAGSDLPPTPPAEPKAGSLRTPPPSDKPPPPMMLEDPALSGPPTPLPVDDPADDPPRHPAHGVRGESPLFSDVEDTGPIQAIEPVVTVEESQWKVELARPARLVQLGWMVSGEVVVGNHRGAQVVVPEVRAARDQTFAPTDYYKLFVRGRKGSVTVLEEKDARIITGGKTVPSTDDLDTATLEIVRRDIHLDPDFDVMLNITRDASLPDPRARMLTVDTADRLVAALFTIGFPMRADRRTWIGPVRATFRFDGALLRITDYLKTYRTGGGFLPFFVREGDRPWQTVPEDGARVELNPGDGLIVGTAVYRFET